MRNDGITLKAYAKINLSLDVLGKRADGYHDIRSFMQGIDLYDTVSVEFKDEKTSNIGCFMGDLAVDFCIDNSTIPNGMDNLALKGAKAVIEAVRASRRDVAIPEGLDLCVSKNIPVAAGLAGGSGNAAAVMLAVNKLLGNVFTLEELMKMGASIGADVPFSTTMNAKKNKGSLTGLKGIENASSAATVTGIGDIVDPEEPLHRYVILINPGIAVSTKEVYETIDEMPCDEAGHGELFHNIMEGCTLVKYADADRLRSAMADNLRAETVLMSGSGPTMVAYYSDADAAKKDYDSLEDSEWFDKKWRAWCVESGGNK